MIISAPGPAGYSYLKRTVYTASGTHTYDIKTRAVKIYAQGAGGGGGGADCTGGSTHDIRGGGGGEGGRSEKFITSGFTAGGTETVTIGAGGTAGTNTGGNGGQGGTTSFGAHVSVTGGAGGTGSGPNSTAENDQAGGAGGVGSGGDINYTGKSGHIGHSVVNANRTYLLVPYFGGAGANSSWGLGGAARDVGSQGAGNPATGKGSGGGGGLSNTAAGQFGGAGMAGFIIVEEYA